MNIRCLFICLLSVPLSRCWQYFTEMNGVASENNIWTPIMISQSDYVYGNCKDKSNKLYTHVHIDASETIEKLVFRGWLNIKRLPTCIRLKASVYEGDQIHGDDFQFQICTARVTFIYGKKRYHYYFFEWFIPIEIAKGPNWDIYFYGPAGADWV